MKLHTMIALLAGLSFLVSSMEAAEVAAPKLLPYVKEGVYVAAVPSSPTGFAGTNALELRGGRFRQWRFNPILGERRAEGGRSAGAELATGTYTTNGNVVKMVVPPGEIRRSRAGEYQCVEFEGQVYLWNINRSPAMQRAGVTNFIPSTALKLTDRKLDDIMVGK